MNDKTLKNRLPQDFIKKEMFRKIRDCSEWRKYFAMWNLCEDMNRPLAYNQFICQEYPFKSQKIPTQTGESIVDFPTFLLNCYRLWIVERENVSEILAKIPHTADNLLESMWYSESNKHAFLFAYRDKNDYIDFIETMFYYRVLFDCYVIRGDECVIISIIGRRELAQMQKELKDKCDKFGFSYRWLEAFLYHLRLERDDMRECIMQFVNYKSITTKIDNFKNIVANLFYIGTEFEHKCALFLSRLNNDSFLGGA